MPKKNPTSESQPMHPGQFVRETCLESKGLSVIAASKLLGVGRPAFSNFLNGNASATPEMAARIQIAFGLPKETLLSMQSAFDAAIASQKASPADAMPYTVPFLGLKAREIEAWAERNIASRSRLAVLLRTLIHSTARDIQAIDFPGNDDAERPGWDGTLEVKEATPWLPPGRSGWEFGTNLNPKEKANSDYAKSLLQGTSEERSRTTFVFVTPRHWPGKNDWERAQKRKSHWFDVRALDSCDLEQWLEHSISSQVWFALETGKPTHGVRSLDQCWKDWANVSEPILPADLFAPAIQMAKTTMGSRLSRPPGDPIVIRADSTEEALAFLAQFFLNSGEPQLAAMRDQVLVFDEPGSVAQLAKGTAKFIAVAHSREVEHELAKIIRTHHCVVILPRNSASMEATITLEPLGYEAFRAPLEAVGFSGDEIRRLENESGRSLTVLRRRLSKIPSVRVPNWASNIDVTAAIVPFMLAGVWNDSNLADQVLLSLLAEKSYDKLEKETQALLQLSDPPLWSVGSYRGVNSKVDLLFSVSASVSRQDLNRFYEVAQLILGEDNPALDLPEDQQWAAALYGKSREFSAPLRRSISETLVLLSVYGNRLSVERLGFDCEAASNALVRRILTPLDTRRLEANDGDLAAYAEAAPDEFLRIIENDLATAAPHTFGLMRPAGAGAFGSGCARTGLLWALEGLAWNPATMPRVARILASLSRIEINDNWVNRPINSLRAMFRSWMPQTAANVDTRLAVLQHLAVRFPRAAWNVCIEQLRSGTRTGGYSHKPKWRNDGYGYGESLTSWDPIHSFVGSVVAMVLDWKGGYDRKMLCDLVDCVSVLAENDQARLWEIVEKWASSSTDSDKAAVRERVRTRLLSRRGKRTPGSTALTAAAKKARATLEPSDVLQRHAWLFRQHWVQESADELEEEPADFEARDKRIAELRTTALREIYEARGIEGIVEVSELGDASYLIGYLFAERVVGMREAVDVIAYVLGEGVQTTGSRRGLVGGLINGGSDAAYREGLLDELSRILPEHDFARLLLCAPFRRTVWLRVDTLGHAAQDLYWGEIYPGHIGNCVEESMEAARRLIAASRPRAAFEAVHSCLKSTDPELLHAILSHVTDSSIEEAAFRSFDQYHIAKAFERIAGSGIFSMEQLAVLEYKYLDVLVDVGGDGRKYRIPNLELYVEAHPELYIQSIVHAFRRADGRTDPDAYVVPPDRVALCAQRGYKLLESLRRTPGHDDAGNLNAARLAAWVAAVRNACEELGRLEVAEVHIGQLLARSPPTADGLWPSEPIRDVLEDVRSTAIMRGAHTGLFNLRGVHSRDFGGNQERALADKYRSWADALQYTHPFVSSELLMQMTRTYEEQAQREDTEERLRRKFS